MCEEKIRVFGSLIPGAPSECSFYRLAPSGSSRVYYRCVANESSYVCVYNENAEENQTFVRISAFLTQLDAAVPQMYARSACWRYLVLEDLGDDSLFHKMQAVGDEGRAFDVYASVVDELLHFQRRFVDHSDKPLLPVFDDKYMLRDLRYFRYSFLSLMNVTVNDLRFERECSLFVERLVQTSPSFFMFRDFQSTNILLSQHKTFYLDYQGACLGPLQYDLVSLLYDSKVRLSAALRKDLLAYSGQRVAALKLMSVDEFVGLYYPFALLRVLQALGAYALRGVHERKAQFLGSILPGLRDLEFLVSELHGVLPLGLSELLQEVLASKCAERVFAEESVRDVEVFVVGKESREMDECDLFLDCGRAKNREVARGGSLDDVYSVQVLVRAFTVLVDECVCSGSGVLRIVCAGEDGDLVAYCAERVTSYLQERFFSNVRVVYLPCVRAV